jgi:hypothetical protein
MVLSAAKFISPQQGAYIAPVLKFSKVNGQSASLLGVKGGWVIDRSFVIGAEFYSLNTNVSSNWTDPSTGIVPAMNFNTGGLNFEYILIHEYSFSVSAEIFMGGAGLTLAPSAFYGCDFLIWEPQLNVSINLNEWLHLSLGGSYRTTSSLDVYHIDGSGNYPPLDLHISNLRGWTGTIAFVFGMY